MRRSPTRSSWQRARIGSRARTRPWRRATPARRRTTPDAEVDDALAEDEPQSGPLRRCIVTREQAERERMLRFVVGPERQIVPDLSAKLPGRGIWLSARRDVLETARSKNAFARAARAQVIVPPHLTQLVQDGLTRRVTELLGLARRAGQANCGFERAREWLAGGRAGLVIQAQDGSPDERSRFISGRRDVPVATPLPAAALGAVFGRDHVVHVVVAPGRLAETLIVEAYRLAGVAGQGGGRVETDRLAGVAGPRGGMEQAQ